MYGLVTRDLEKAAPYNARSWTTLDEALADPAVHAVYVATPVFLHAPQTIQTLRAGKPVLCEKPMAMNEAEARSMVEIAEQSGLSFGVAYYRRMYPKVRRAKQLLDAGVIGQPVLAELTATGGLTKTKLIAVGCSIQPRPEAARSSTSPRTALTC